MITNSLFRIAVQRKGNHTTAASFDTQNRRINDYAEKSIISKASTGVYLGRNTIVSHNKLAENTTASISHFKRVADFLELGDGVWYKVHPTAIEFLDGYHEPASRKEGPTLTHFR